MSSVLFSFSAKASHAFTPTTNLSMTVGLTTGMLSVQLPEQPTANYALIDIESEPLPRAIYIDTSTAPMTLKIGHVTYARDCQFVQFFALNEVTVNFLPANNRAGIGIMDVRDFDKDASIIDYLLDAMPVIVSIEGNHLVVKTLQYEEDDDVIPWYKVK